MTDSRFTPDPNELEWSDERERVQDRIEARVARPFVVPAIPAYDSEYDDRQHWNVPPDWKE